MGKSQRFECVFLHFSVSLTFYTHSPQRQEPSKMLESLKKHNKIKNGHLPTPVIGL